MKETKTSKITRTSTTVAPAKKVDSSPYDLLEPAEEKAIRMHYGLSENDDKVLDYAVGASEETRLRVSLIEAGSISDLNANVPVAKGADRAILREFVKGLDI